MRVLLDAAHGADVWVLGAVEERLLAEGAETHWLSRAGKDSVVELIEARGRPHVVASTAGTDRRSLASELVARDRVAWREARSFRPDLILTRSPAGVHAARLTRTPVIYDTDDGRAAGMLFRVAGPLASLITSPTANTEDYGKKHRRYRGYKELFYLHPNRFTPDPDIHAELGLSAGELFHVLRLSALTASHDVGQAGLDDAQIEQVVAILSQSGTVMISSERDLPPEMESRRIRARPERFHHVLAAASSVVGDSQTVCSEAGVVGTPSVRLSSWAGRLPYQLELQERWGLTTAFLPEASADFFASLERLVDDHASVQEAHDSGRRRMLEWCGDPVDDLVDWAHELVGR